MEKTARLYPPEQVTMLFAQFLDKQFLQMLNDLVKDICDLQLGGLLSANYLAEIQCLSSFCYYLPSLLFFACTPGQSYCGLRMITRHENPTTKQHMINTYHSVQRRLCLVVLYSLIPYCYARKELLWQKLVDLWNILTQEERDLTPPSLPPSSTSDSETANNADNTVSNSAPIEKRWSIRQVLWTAGRNTLQTIAPTTTQYLENTSQFLYELHLCAFLYSGK